MHLNQNNNHIVCVHVWSSEYGSILDENQRCQIKWLCNKPLRGIEFFSIMTAVISIKTIKPTRTYCREYVMQASPHSIYARYLWYSLKTWDSNKRWLMPPKIYHFIDAIKKYPEYKNVSKSCYTHKMYNKQRGDFAFDGA